MALTQPTRDVWARWTFHGWHSWPEAGSIGRDYLASRHRHLFHVRVQLSVEHNDREVEFHDLLEHCMEATPSGDLGRSSCEDIAERIAAHVAERWPGRRLVITVAEDDEVGATLTWEST